MSTYRAKAIHPATGEVVVATFIDDYFGKHRYGVEFDDGDVYPIDTIEAVHDDDDGDDVG